MKRMFEEKLKNANEEYVQYLEHMHTVFKIDLETALNEEVDKQTKELTFDGNRIRKVM